MYTISYRRARASAWMSWTLIPLASISSSEWARIRSEQAAKRPHSSSEISLRLMVGISIPARLAIRRSASLYWFVSRL